MARDGHLYGRLYRHEGVSGTGLHPLHPGGRPVPVAPRAVSHRRWRGARELGGWFVVTRPTHPPVVSAPPQAFGSSACYLLSGALARPVVGRLFPAKLEALRLRAEAEKERLRLTACRERRRRSLLTRRLLASRSTCSSSTCGCG